MTEKEIITKLKQCNKFKQDYLIESDELAYVFDYINDLKEKLKETNKGLKKVISRSTKYKNKYYNIKHNWNKLEEWLRTIYNYDKNVISKDYINCVDEVLNKMQQIKGSDNNT